MTGTFAERLAGVIETRATRPGAVAEAAANRRRPSAPPARLMIIAADHPARGALRAGDDPLAMGDRGRLLERMCAALARPGVDGVLGTPDVIEDLLLLGALDGKVVLGSMNRGGLAGSAFEIDDRFTGYTPAAIAAAGLDGGKMLLRVDLEDPATARTLESCAHAVTGLAGHGLMAMVEPFLSTRAGGGRIRNVLTPEAMIQVMSIASGLGATSAHTWLKVPVVDRMEEVMAASTLPAVLLGGEVPADPDAALAGWAKALALPSVRGLVVGRTLLYPPDDDVAAAVDAAVGLL
ncbi:Cgl0159 family (beta/alpha)8-fold protein [Actinomadura litoris]|uniref:Cgl0159 family (beta/alpha)8-fold protein n=1 Tax=Actinomadura litoris TaxID=2678616 RepID=UPI001FA77F9B|nr:aldolase [Actinomadura litoris]